MILPESEIVYHQDLSANNGASSNSTAPDTYIASLSAGADMVFEQVRMCVCVCVCVCGYMHCVRVCKCVLCVNKANRQYCLAL